MAMAGRQQTKRKRNDLALSSLCRGYGAANGIAIPETPHSQQRQALREQDQGRHVQLLQSAHQQHPSPWHTDYDRSFTDSCRQLELPKTYLTRRGDMILFAHQFLCRKRKRWRQHSPDRSDGRNWLTFKDFQAQLSRHLKQDNGTIKDKFHRQPTAEELVYFRPGFSPVRYLASWSRLWEQGDLDNIKLYDSLLQQHIEHYGSIRLPDINPKDANAPLALILKPKPRPFSSLSLPSIGHDCEAAVVHTNGNDGLATRMRGPETQSCVSSKRSKQKLCSAHSWSLRSEASSTDCEASAHRLRSFPRLSVNQQVKITPDLRKGNTSSSFSHDNESDEFTSYFQNSNIDTQDADELLQRFKHEAFDTHKQELLERKTQFSTSSKISLNSIGSSKTSFHNVVTMDTFSKLPPIHSAQSASGDYDENTSQSVKFPYIQRRFVGHKMSSDITTTIDTSSAITNDLHVRGMGLDTSEITEECSSADISQTTSPMAGLTQIGDYECHDSDSEGEWQEAAKVATALATERQSRNVALLDGERQEHASLPLEMDSRGRIDTEVESGGLTVLSSGKKLEVATTESPLVKTTPLPETKTDYVGLEERHAPIGLKECPDSETGAAQRENTCSSNDKEPMTNINHLSSESINEDKMKNNTLNVRVLENKDKQSTEASHSEQPTATRNDQTIDKARTLQITDEEKPATSSPSATLLRQTKHEVSFLEPESATDESFFTEDGSGKSMSKDDTKSSSQTIQKQKRTKERTRKTEEKKNKSKKKVIKSKQQNAGSSRMGMAKPETQTVETKQQSAKSKLPASPPFHTGVVPEEAAPKSLGNSNINNQNQMKRVIVKKTKRQSTVVMGTSEQSKAAVHLTQQEDVVEQGHNIESTADVQGNIHGDLKSSTSNDLESDATISTVLQASDHNATAQEPEGDAQEERGEHLQPDDQPLNIADARAKKRAIAAEKRRLLVEQRRLEKEDEKRKAQEKAEREEQLRTEAENDRQRRMEQRKRIREEEEQASREQEDRRKAEQMELQREQEKRRRESESRRFKLMSIAAEIKLEEDMKREREALEREIELEMQLKEQELMAKMEEQERIAYEIKLREEDERRRLADIEQRQLTEQQKQKEAATHKQLLAELQEMQRNIIERNKVIKDMKNDSSCLGVEHQLSRAFVYSYFEKAPHLISPFVGLKCLGKSNERQKLPSIPET